MDESLIARNNAILSQENVGLFKKRLKRELIKMYPNYDHIEVELKNVYKADVTIYKIANGELHRYTFGIKRDYPFIAPETFYQGRPYHELLKLQYTQTENNVFKQVTGQNCFCCYSINTNNNWSPDTTLEKIIEEIQTIRKKKRDIVNKLIADIIKRTYLIEDIDIDSWLF